MDAFDGKKPPSSYSWQARYLESVYKGGVSSWIAGASVLPEADLEGNQGKGSCMVSKHSFRLAGSKSVFNPLFL